MSVKTKEQFFVPLLLALLLTSLGVQAAAQGQKIIRVTAKLSRVMGPGGETTSWSVTLDSKIVVDGQQLSSIEVEGQASKLDKLENKRVKIQGPHQPPSRGYTP